MLDQLRDEMTREVKRSIFTMGHTRDWFCRVCSKMMDIDNRVPFIISTHVNGKQVAKIHVCEHCLNDNGGAAAAEDMKQRAKRAWFKQHPDRHDADHVPGEGQTMIDGTRPDPAMIDRITIEIF